MRTIGRVLFLFLSLLTGGWLAFSLRTVFLSLDRPDAVPVAMGAATVPALMFIVSVYFFCGLAPKGTKKADSDRPTT